MRLIRYQNSPSTSAAALDRFFGFHNRAMGRSKPLFAGFSSAATAASQIDVFEDAQAYYVRLELPGKSKEDLELKLEESVLKLSLKSTPENDDSELKTRALRSIAVPETVDQGSVSATLENGVLTVRLPIVESSKSRRIEINPIG